MAYADIHNGDSVAYPTGQTIDYNLSVSADTHSNTPQPAPLCPRALTGCKVRVAQV